VYAADKLNVFGPDLFALSVDGFPVKLAERTDSQNGPKRACHGNRRVFPDDSNEVTMTGRSP
jgi:hypothetical protein